MILVLVLEIERKLLELLDTVRLDFLFEGLNNNHKFEIRQYDELRQHTFPILSSDKIWILVVTFLSTYRKQKGGLHS